VDVAGLADDDVVGEFDAEDPRGVDEAAGEDRQVFYPITAPVAGLSRSGACGNMEPI